MFLIEINLVIVSRLELLIFFDATFSDDFRMYDYGGTRNLGLYGKLKPPTYNLKNIIAPVALFYGRGDAIVSEEVRMLLVS